MECTCVRSVTLYSNICNVMDADAKGDWQMTSANLCIYTSIPIVFDTGVGGVCVSVGMIPRNTIVSQNDGSSCTEDER